MNKTWPQSNKCVSFYPDCAANAWPEVISKLNVILSSHGQYHYKICYISACTLITSRWAGVVLHVDLSSGNTLVNRNDSDTVF